VSSEGAASVAGASVAGASVATAVGAAVGLAPQDARTVLAIARIDKTIISFLLIFFSFYSLDIKDGFGWFLFWRCNFFVCDRPPFLIK
jgi:hypothetical protein